MMMMMMMTQNPVNSFEEDSSGGAEGVEVERPERLKMGNLNQIDVWWEMVYAGWQEIVLELLYALGWWEMVCAPAKTLNG